MSPAFPARRRADEFDRLAESASTDGDAATLTAGSELQHLAALATSLREVPEVAPRADFSASLRERLMAAAATELTATAATEQTDTEERLTVRRPAARTGRRQRRLTAAIAALAVVGATTGTALAAQNALPGDTLYPVKRAIEGVRSDVTLGDQSKGSTMLHEADTRLSEVHQLSQRSHSGTVDAKQVNDTLATFSSQAKQASELLVSDYQQHHDAASLTKLQSFTSQGVDQLGQLATVLPQTAQTALDGAAQTLLDIDKVVQQLCPTCGPAVTQLPSTLLQGVASTLTDLGNVLAPPAKGGQKGTDASQDHGDGGKQPAGSQSQGGGLGALLPPPANASTPPPAGGNTPKSSTPAQPQRSNGAGPKTSGTTPKDPTGLTSALGGVASGVGGVVSGVASGVGGLLNGLVGGLLGGASNTPKP
jgi:hypothetical protein